MRILVAGLFAFLSLAQVQARPPVTAPTYDLRRFQGTHGIEPNQRDDFGVSRLEIAAATGDFEAAKDLLERGAWPYTMDANGDTPLRIAKRRITDAAQASAMAQLLLKHGAPAGGGNRPIDTQYLNAIIRGDLPAVKAALAKGADINARRQITLDNAVGEAVTLAVFHPELLAYLIESGIYTGARNSAGFTPLHYAAGEGGNLKSIRLLVDHGMDIDVKSSAGETPLGIAVNRNKPSAVELLLSLGADAKLPGIGGSSLLDLARRPNHSALIAPMLEKAGAVADPPGTQSPGCSLSEKPALPCALAFYARNGNYTGIEKALAAHADINAREPGQPSLLSLALMLPKSRLDMSTPYMQTESAYAGFVERKLKTAHLLLDHQIDVTAADGNGLTALHLAANDPRLVEFIQLLVDKGANPNAVASLYRTSPIHVAVHVKNKAGVESLLAHGADPNVAMAGGITPLLIAAEDKQLEIASTLLKHGAKTDRGADSTLTPLKAAVQDSNIELIQRLLEAGADPDFDGGAAPSPRVMSRDKAPAVQALFAAPAGR